MSYVTLISSPPAVGLYALSISTDPERGLTSLSYYSPVPLVLVHFIKSANRSESLIKTLEVKFTPKRDHGFWYRFETADVDYIKSLNESNFQNQIGFIQQALKKPEFTPQELRRQAEQLLEKAEAALV